MDSLKAIAIESGSWLFMLAAALGVYFTAKWKNARHITGFNGRVIKAWGWIAGAIVVNAGWRALMFEWRWLIALATASAFAHGMISFIRLIEDFSVTAQWAMFTALVGVSLALGIF